MGASSIRIQIEKMLNFCFFSWNNMGVFSDCVSFIFEVKISFVCVIYIPSRIRQLMEKFGCGLKYAYTEHGPGFSHSVVLGLGYSRARSFSGLVIPGLGHSRARSFPVSKIVERVIDIVAALVIDNTDLHYRLLMLQLCQ